jgi:hypothetical protein
VQFAGMAQLGQGLKSDGTASYSIWGNLIGAGIHLFSSEDLLNGDRVLKGDCDF